MFAACFCESVFYDSADVACAHSADMTTMRLSGKKKHALSMPDIVPQVCFCLPALRRLWMRRVAFTRLQSCCQPTPLFRRWEDWNEAPLLRLLWSLLWVILLPQTLQFVCGVEVEVNDELSAVEKSPLTPCRLIYTLSPFFFSHSVTRWCKNSTEMLADELRKHIVVVEASGSLPGLQGSDRAWMPAAVCGRPGEAAGSRHMARGNNTWSQ